ncbi:MAG: tyrosine--tRNA ligase [Lachnospirales bacterium]
MKNIVDKMSERGYVYQSNNIDNLKKLLDEEKVTFYLGVDPTAESLHIGHFLSLQMFRKLQDAGHQGIIVLGGATSLIGDPSGKSDMRQMLTKEQVATNVEKLKNIMKKYIKVDGENPAIFTDNADWTCPLSFIDFMREVGVHFNVNKMLSADAYANRIKEGGLTFLEMSYMLMQSYDFVHLNRAYNCRLQIGGSDQWGNMLSGSTLNRKLNNVDEDAEFNKDLFVLTCPLLVNKDGVKMGKTVDGALWIDKEKTSTFDFYQYFYNLDDAEIVKLLKLFSEIPVEEIERLFAEDVVNAKKTMAYEVTKLVHGVEEADKVLEAIKSLYSGASNLDNVPSFEVKKEELEVGISLLDLLVSSSLSPTKSEARRNVEQGGVSINSEKVTDVNYVVTLNDINEDHILIKRGKKNFSKIIF